MTTRRGFLLGMLALGAAPAIVRAASLMPVVTPAGLVVPAWVGIDVAKKAAELTAIIRDDQYFIIMHPSAKQMIMGSANYVIRREVTRYGR